MFIYMDRAVLEVSRLQQTLSPRQQRPSAGRSSPPAAVIPPVVPLPPCGAAAAQWCRHGDPPAGAAGAAGAGDAAAVPRAAADR